MAERLRQHFELASKCFSDARSLFRENPHAHLSLVDMILEIHNESQEMLWKDAIKRLKVSNYILNAPDEAFYLLDQYKEICMSLYYYI